VKDKRILVEPSAWRTVLCAGFDPEKTARHLRNEGLLHTDPGKLQRQEKILRGGSVEKGRFYCLDMRILEDAAAPGRMRLRRNLLLSSHAVSVSHPFRRVVPVVPVVPAWSRAHQGGTTGVIEGTGI
jgi:hypothetical protein